MIVRWAQDPDDSKATRNVRALSGTFWLTLRNRFGLLRLLLCFRDLNARESLSRQMRLRQRRSAVPATRSSWQGAASGALNVLCFIVHHKQCTADSRHHPEAEIRIAVCCYKSRPGRFCLILK